MGTKLKIDTEVAKFWKDNTNETGVVIGYGLNQILVAFPTPPSESAEDTEWVAEHAMQVSRMLVGGINVRGVYVREIQDKWANKYEFLNKCTQSIASALEESGSMYHVTCGLFQILVDPSEKYWCKHVFTQSTTHPELEVILQPSLSQKLHTFTTTFSLSLNIPIWKEKTQVALQASLQPSIGNSVDALHLHLRKATALVDGQAYSLAELVQKTNLSSSGKQHEVTIFSPIGANLSVTQPSKGKGPAIVGNVDINGNIVAVAVCDTNVEDALDLLILDLCATLRTRLAMMCENESDLPELASRIVARLPISRTNPDYTNSFLVCDYVTADEDDSELHDRIRALLDVDIGTSKLGNELGVVLREDSKPLQTNQNNQKSLSSSPSSSSNTISKNENNNSNNTVAKPAGGNKFTLLVAVVVGILAFFVFFLQK